MSRINVIVVATLLVVTCQAFLIEEATLKFSDFKSKHGKTYKNEVEEQKRFTIFKNNLEVIEKHNELYKKGLSLYSMGINQFTDLTKEEFIATLNGQESPKFKTLKKFELPEGLTTPDSKDWRQQGVVTGVKNQGSCGSCWAFSVTGAIESANGIKTGDSQALSEQQLIDCSKGNGNGGCNGGSFGNSYAYIEQNGLQGESSYGYEAKDGDCRYDSNQVVARVSSHVTVGGDENNLKDAVGNIGPVSIAIDASGIQSYSNGIFNGDCDPSHINHAVLAIGYGNENGNDFWIVKNSWGDGWGEGGYFRIERGSNKCGITHENVYPVV